MAGLPKQLIENPEPATAGRAPEGDVLSDVLRTVRLSGSLQFCFMPAGAWRTDATPSLVRTLDMPPNMIPFHIVVEGACWLRMDDREVMLAAGDVVAFPFGTGHQLGVGSGGRSITPMLDLPPRPWRDLPVLRYGDENPRVRLLCGYLHCDGLNFRPLRNALPPLLHVSTRRQDNTDWLRATIGQIAAEVDRPRTGGLSMLERLTEITFIELLRHQIIAAGAGAVGWLAALADPALGRCLSLIHDDPRREWSVPELASASGLSRTTLTERFETMLDTSPMRYVREWRLCQASVALGTTSMTVAAVAYDAGYGTEAAFSRAFSRAFGMPPAAWRQTARRGPTG